MDFSAEAEKYREEFLILLGQWVNIRSVYDESSIANSMPFGKGVSDALEWLASLGAIDGFEAKNVDGYAAHVEYGEGEEYVYAFGHCDVVPEGEGWHQEPFKLFRSGDKLIGRGVVDDKGPLLAAYLALKLLKNNNIILKRRIRVAAGGNEESGFRCIKHYFKSEPKPTYGFTPDAKFPVINGEMGSAVIKVSGSINNKDLFVKGGQVPNTIPDYVSVKGLKAGVSVEEDFRVMGKGGHSSKPENAINPIEKLFKLLKAEKEEWAYEFCTMIGGDNIDGRLFGLNKTGKCGKLKIVPTIICIEEGKLNLILNIRYPEVTTDQEVTEKIKKHMESHGLQNYEVTCSGIKKPSFVSEDSPLIKTLLDIYVKHTGDTVNKVRVTSAGTYASEMENSVVFGGEFPDGSSGNVHGSDEYGSLDAFITSIGIYAEAFYELSRL